MKAHIINLQAVLILALLITPAFSQESHDSLVDYGAYFADIAWDDFEGEPPVPVDKYGNLTTLEGDYVAILGIAAKRLDETTVNTVHYYLKGLWEDDVVVVKTNQDYPTTDKHYIVYGYVRSDPEYGILIYELNRQQLIEVGGTITTDTSLAEVEQAGEIKELEDEIARLQRLLNKRQNRLFLGLNTIQLVIIGIAILAVIFGLFMIIKPQREATPVISRYDERDVKIPPPIDSSVRSVTGRSGKNSDEIGAGPGWGYLEIVAGKEVGRKFQLARSEITIGRGKHNDVVLDDLTVSVNHAKIVDSGKTKLTGEPSLVFIDRSTNGSAVNGRNIRKEQADLPSGSTINIGQYEMVLRTIVSPVSAHGRDDVHSVDKPGQKKNENLRQQGYRLIVTSNGKNHEKSHLVVHHETKIGRSPDNDLVLEDEWISGRHAVIRLIDTNWQIENLSRSKQGTTVNGNKVEGHVILKPGDVIGMGPTRIEFRKT